MKRALQTFTGTLQDRELYTIEDALKAYKEQGFKTKINVDKLILKLYQEFHEAETPS